MSDNVDENNTATTSYPLPFTPDEGLALDGYDSDEFFGMDIGDFTSIQVDDDIRYLQKEDQLSIHQALLPSQSSDDNWSDCLISDVGEECIFVLDKATKDAWQKCQEEVHYIRDHLHSLLQIDPSEKMKLSHLADLAFGPRSDFASSFCNELNLDRDTFVSFIGNMCLQMSYKETPSSMYDNFSELKKSTLMSQSKYMEIWKAISTKRRVTLKHFVGSSRREKCLWEICEEAVNKFLRTVSIVQRTDDVSVALDDDKIWVESSGENSTDEFGLRKVTHVKDNRKGIIAHTTVSTSTNLPFSFIFERKGNSAVECFTQIFGKMFPSSDGRLPNLNGVTNHSDRGYTLKQTLFDFLLPAGADFNNTAKRIPPFPFLWGMKLTQNDKRKLLDEKGAPTIFIRETMKSNRLVSCTAFRTGTNNISAVVTTTNHGHQWEGICLHPKQTAAYERDMEHGLDSLIFEMLASSNELVAMHQNEMKEELSELKNEKIDVLTLEQGSADWHKGRQFSLTSSQADGSFRKAFILYQSNDDWCDTAEYLYGERYYECE